ncbi:MAG: M13 family metallopeptidase [Candidatus Micrarchaeia archaeon]
MENRSPYGNLGFSVKYIDWKVDPFEDFYMFSNGKWIGTHKLPQDKTELSSFFMLQEANLAKLHGIVESCRRSSGKRAEEKLVGNFYTSYMDLKSIEKNKFNPIIPIVDSIKNTNSKGDLTQLIASLYMNGVSTFIILFSDSDKKNSSIYALYAWELGINLPDRGYYFDKRFKKIRLEYRNHIEKMLSFYGFGQKEKEQMAVSIIGVETKLAKAMRTKAEERDEVKNYNKISIFELSKYKNFNITAIFGKLGLVNLSYVIVNNPKYIKAVDSLIEKEKLSRLKAYFIWSVINSYASLLHKEARMEHFRFYGTVLSGQKKIDPRWKRGIYRINNMIGDALDSLYIKEYFSEHTKIKAELLLESLKNAFRNRLQNNKWMTPKTKKLALEKLDAMEFKVGYPKRFKKYSGLIIEKNDLVGNVIRSYQYELNRQFKRVGKKVDREEWTMPASEVNANYDDVKNQVEIPAGILEPPFFDADADIAINLGGIGGTIGHEMTHGFDDQGRLFDKDGNLSNWWTPEDRKHFLEFASRIEKLYGSISILPGLNINGKLTIGENIADLGGISIAYDALKAHGFPQEKVEGFTEEQRFFIAWAQIWKSIIAKKTKELRAYVDPHSPENVRGLVPVVSHPSFEQAFRPLSKLKRVKQEYKNVNLW